jgi:hypothetical protein
MKHILLALSLFAAASASHCADRTLPALALFDPAGAAAPAAVMNMAAPWVMLMVAASGPQTESALARLQPPAEGWGGKVVVVVQGDTAQLRALVAKHPALAGVRWYRDADGSARRALKLPGLPALLAMDANKHVVWQTDGLPPQPDKAQNLVRAWVAPVAAK